ncbi:MAG TPA: succinylglutamate desuccinylase/aspartoacylase, partial [Acidobacteriota bacterium]
DIRLEGSPPTLRGLSHREWGDWAGIHSILIETPNAAQGRLKGKPTTNLILEGKDKFYFRAAGLGRLFVPFGREGIPLRVRVARHLAAVQALVSSFNGLSPDKEILIEGLPAPSEMQKKDVGFFLRPPD